MTTPDETPGSETAATPDGTPAEIPEETAVEVPAGPLLPGRLDALVLALAESRAMPLSGALIGNRSELLSLVEEVREAVPAELYQADELLRTAREAAERAEVEAEAIVAEARAAAAALVEDHAVVVAARERAEEILAEARAAAADLLAEAEAALGRLVVGAQLSRARLEADQDSSTGSRVNPEPG